MEELLAERGVEVDHVTVYGWVRRFTPVVVDAARPCRHAVGERWHVDETYLKVGGAWRYLYRAIDQFGQVIDVCLSTQRDARAAQGFFTRAIATTQSEPAEVVTDRAWVYLGVLDELLPGALHDVEQYANNVLEADARPAEVPAATHAGDEDHDRRPARLLRPMPSCRTLRRGHYELAVDAPPKRRLAQAFAELALAI